MISATHAGPDNLNNRSGLTTVLAVRYGDRPLLFDAHYAGFEQHFGSFNFGTGNAQLDFQNMIFDWACG